MFDYHAGEKYKLTLIMVGFAGAMAGMFFTVLFLGDAQPQQAHARKRPKWADHPDVTGKGDLRNHGRRAVDGQMAYGNDGVDTRPRRDQQAQPYAATNPQEAMSLIEQWLPGAWDLSAGSAKYSQEKAIQCMTADCAQAYRSNIWTPEIAQQIEQSGLKSSFQASKISIGSTKPDGAVVVLVEGQQILEVPGKPARSRPVQLEYLVKKTDAGLKIAGISEGTPQYGS